MGDKNKPKRHIVFNHKLSDNDILSRIEDIYKTRTEGILESMGSMDMADITKKVIHTSKIYKNIVEFYKYQELSGDTKKLPSLHQVITLAEKYSGYFQYRFFEHFSRVLDSKIPFKEKIKRLRLLDELESIDSTQYDRFSFEKKARIVTLCDDFYERLDICLETQEEIGFLYHDDVWWIFRGRGVTEDFIRKSRQTLATYDSVDTPYRSLWGERKTLRYSFNRSIDLDQELQSREELLKRFSNQITFTDEQKEALMKDWNIINDSLEFYLGLYAEYTPPGQDSDCIEKFLKHTWSRFITSQDWLQTPERAKDLEAVIKRIKEQGYLRESTEDEIPF